MTDPKFLLESYDSQGIRDKCKKIIKGGLKIDILGDEFFDTIDNNYITPLLNVVYENYHLILNFKTTTIADAEVVMITVRRCYRAFNPTEEERYLFPDKRIVWSRYVIEDNYKAYKKGIKEEKIHPYKLISIKFDDRDCSKEYLKKIISKYDPENETYNVTLESDNKVLPYKMVNKMKSVDYDEVYIFPLDSDFYIWIFKTIVKGISIILNYPNEKLDVCAYVTTSFPDKKGKFAKKTEGMKGEESIISSDIFFPGTSLFVHWKQK
jgi:hypothetical protein